MKILLVDADSKIPNLALMKLSTFHKQKKDLVTLLKLNISYYPNRRHKIHNLPNGYDKIYCSVIFKGADVFIKGQNIIYGGSGYSLNKVLPESVEVLDPDYSIYPDNDTSYGFISRGCIRNCYFCDVPEKEGKLKQVSNLDKIIKHKKVKFLDNNFLALSTHKQILGKLISQNVKCQFNQGLDIRLVDKETSILLSKLNYIGEYIFSFDDWTYLKTIELKLPLLSWKKNWQFKFFVYCHPNMKIENITNRIKYLRNKKILPYLMRDITCWNSKYQLFYTDIAAWCNQPALFKKMNFLDFLNKRHTRRNNRIENSNFLYNAKMP